MKPLSALAFFAIAVPVMTSTASALDLKGIREVAIAEVVDATATECRIGAEKMREAMHAAFTKVGVTVHPGLDTPAIDKDGVVRQPIRVRMGNVAAYDRKRNLCFGYLEFQILEYTGLTSPRIARHGPADPAAFGHVELAQIRITGAYAPGEYQRLVWTDVSSGIRHFAALIGREADS
jgi:hypothetical protein